LDLNDYIESGIIESYLLGLASAEESELFEHMRSLYPELNTEIAATEYRLQKVIDEDGVTPPAKVWNKISERLAPHGRGGYYSRAGGQQAEASQTYVLQPRSNTITVSIWWRCTVIAMILLIMGLVASTVYFYQQFRRMEERLMRLYPTHTEMSSPAKR
jgi:anti-sigma-K factor RskA